MVLCVIASAVVGCGSQSGYGPWDKVGTCLNGHPDISGDNGLGVGKGYAGNLPGTRVISQLSIGALSVSGGEAANAYLYDSAAAAKEDTKGISSPGPTVYLYGPVALEINQNIGSVGNVIRGCFASDFGSTGMAESNAKAVTASTNTGTVNSRATGTSVGAGTSTTGCGSSHIASYACSTAQNPFCAQGNCLYPVPISGKCAQGYQLDGSPQACHQLPKAASDGALTCPLGETVSAATSCGFAAMVMSNYEAKPASSITAVSPVTGRSYNMSCATRGAHVTCTGGNGAMVSFKWPT